METGEGGRDEKVQGVRGRPFSTLRALLYVNVVHRDKEIFTIENHR